MQMTIDATNKRREKQTAYNIKNNITPTALNKSRESILNQTTVGRHIQARAYIENEQINLAADPVVQYMSKEQLKRNIDKTRKEMDKAAKDMDFFEAARLRDEMFALEKLMGEKD